MGWSSYLEDNMEISEERIRDSRTKPPNADFTSTDKNAYYSNKNNYTFGQNVTKNKKGDKKK